MKMVFEDEEKKTNKSNYRTTLLLCLLSSLVTVQLIPLLNYAPSLSATLTRAFRDRPPSTYALNIDSYSNLVNSNAQPYDSDVFQSGGYNWTLRLYPSGNTGDEGADHISLYVKLYNPGTLPQGWEIYTKISLFVQVKSRSRYLVVEDTEVQRLDATRTEWGVGKLVQLSTFKNSYLDGDKGQFGVEITVLKPYTKSERISFLDNPQNSDFNWRILRFSQLENSKFIYSDEFPVASTKWKLRVAPKGDGDGHLNCLSIYLDLSDTESLRVNQKVYARATVTVVSKANPSKNVQRKLEKWYSREVPSLGFQKFMSLAYLHDASNGFLVGDSLNIQVQFQLISQTNYIP